MPEPNPPAKLEVDKFVEEKLDSVPHLEALMLLWNSRPVAWAAVELASRLYVTPEHARFLLRDLTRLHLAQESPEQPGRYAYDGGKQAQDDLMQALDDAYRRDLVRISKVIHAKAPSSIREFAKAFQFKRERD